MAMGSTRSGRMGAARTVLACCYSWIGAKPKTRSSAQPIRDYGVVWKGFLGSLGAESNRDDGVFYFPLWLLRRSSDSTWLQQIQFAATAALFTLNPVGLKTRTRPIWRTIRNRGS